MPCKHDEVDWAAFAAMYASDVTRHLGAQMKTDGEPAFPQTSNEWVDRPGMSLRDWFAGQALVGLVINPSMCSPECPISHRAYELADAMLAAREGGETG